MNEEAFEKEVVFYRRAIVEDLSQVDPRFSWVNELPELYQRFKTLEQEDLRHFQKLSATLLQDKERQVSVGMMQLLSAHTMKDHVLSQGLVLIATKKKSVRKEALTALGAGMFTRMVLPQVFVFAEEGNDDALSMVKSMIRTPEEIERGISIARTYIQAEEYYLRQEALFLLQRHSSMDVEAESVLAAVKLYLDELFIDALKDAPPEIVLEPLKALRATIGEQYAEYKDLSSTIEVLEQKKRHEASS
jgi:hypothetical protein